jgi:hypothetical protein
MDRINNKGDTHNARSGMTVYGASDQTSVYAATIKYQYNQLSVTCDRDKRDSIGPNGTK